jgi:hypothetical protein
MCTLGLAQLKHGVCKRRGGESFHCHGFMRLCIESRMAKNLIQKSSGIYMYANVKMITVETVPGIGGNKGELWRG